MTPQQSRMARAALKIGVRDLASMADVAPMTISRLENAQSGGLVDTVTKIKTALELAGVRFIEDGEWVGVMVRRYG